MHYHPPARQPVCPPPNHPPSEPSINCRYGAHTAEETLLAWKQLYHSSIGPTAKPAAERGAKPGAVPGTVPGAEPDAVPGAEPDAVPGAEPDAEPDGRTGRAARRHMRREQGAVPGAEPDAEPDRRNILFILM